MSATNHMSSGAWAAAGGIGTVSAVNADSYDAEGKIVPQVYKSLTRKERHEELIHYGIEGAVAQVERAYEVSGGKGAININVLWEMGGAQQILEGVLARTKGMVAGVTCGAGMPYKLSEIAERHDVMYLPIISSARAFRALWKRAYHKVPHLLGAVVYEDPWLAGGHNGLSNAEDPLVPQDPYPRVKALRDVMTAEGIADTVPIVMAGGVWYLRDWENWIDNPELGQIVFQYGRVRCSPKKVRFRRRGRIACAPSTTAMSCSTDFHLPAFIQARCARRSCAISKPARSARSPIRSRKPATISSSSTSG